MRPQDKLKGNTGSWLYQDKDAKDNKFEDREVYFNFLDYDFELTQSIESPSDILDFKFVSEYTKGQDCNV